MKKKDGKGAAPGGFGGHVVAKRLVAIVLSMALAGCQTMPQVSSSSASTAGLTPDEIRMRQQADAFNNTVVEGCVVGAVAGALLGALVAGGNNRAQGALIGAAAGTAVGCGSGYWVAQSQQQHAITEADLDKMVVDLRNRNSSMAALIVSSKNVIKADKAKIARIDKELKAGRMSMDQARAEMSTVDGNQQYLEKTVIEGRKQLSDWQQTSRNVHSQNSGPSARELDREVANLEKQVSSLESELDALVKRRKLSRVG